MRGAPIEFIKIKGHARIIPADAGSTGMYGTDGDYNKDHPRGCGEHESCNNFS